MGRFLQGNFRTIRKNLNVRGKAEPDKLANVIATRIQIVRLIYKGGAAAPVEGRNCHA
jgi:hypothetical protein